MPGRLSRNLELIIGARDRLTGPIRKMRAVFQRFKKFALSSIKAVAAGFAILTAAAVAFGKIAVDAFAGFETAMRNVFTLLEIGQQEFEALGDSILLMVTRVPQTPQQLGSAVYDIFSAGISDTADALKVLGESALAATAGVTTTKEAAGGAIQIMNAFGRTASDIPDIFDLMFSTVREGVVTFPELASSIGMVTSSFVGAGGSMKEMLGTMAFLTKTVGNANRSSVRLASAVKAMTGRAKEWNDVVTVAIFDQQGAFRGLESIIGDLTKSIGKLTKKEQLDKIKKIVPEKEAQDAIIAMISNYDLFRETLGKVSDSHGAMAQAAEKQMASWANQLRFLKNAFTVVRVSVGELIAAVIGPELGKFTKWLQDVSVRLVKNKTAIKAWLLVIKPTIAAVGRDLVAVIKESMQLAWAFIQEFFRQLKKSPKPLLIIIGGLFVEIPKLLWNSLKRAIEVVGAVAQVIFTPFQGALLWLGSQVRFGLEKFVLVPLQDFVNKAIGAANKVREFFGKEPWPTIELVDPEQIEAAITLEETWKDTISVLEKRFKSVAEIQRGAIVETVNEATSALKELAGVMKTELITPELENRMIRIQVLMENIPTRLKEGYDAAAKAALVAGREAEKTLRDLQAAGQAAAAVVTGDGEGGVAAAAEGFGDIFGKAFAAALGFAGGNAVASLIGLLFEAVNEGDVSGFVNNFADGAIKFMVGLAEGIPDFITTLAKRAPDFIIAMVGSIPILIAELIRAIPEILRALGTGLLKMFEAAGKIIALAFITLVEKLIGGLLRFLGIELRDDIARLQGEIEGLFAEAARPKGPGEMEGMTTANDFRGAAVREVATATGTGAGPTIFNLEFSQPFVMSDQNSMDKLARMLAEADYRQARRSRGATGTAG